MYNIRNIYLDNVGYKDAWFNNLTIPLFEYHTDKVSNTVLSLTNGGGKTTILSLIFSCFVPEQRNFIQHLQKPGHHFKDYFENTPGLILIELEKLAEKETNLFDDKFIIGQYVYINPSDNEPVRYFFSFAPDTFDINSIPTNGNGQLTSRSDLKKWLNESSGTYSNFYYTSKQSEWRQWLDKNSIDTWLAEKQVGFCRSEGGIDKFMSFQSERDFLKEFFFMSLSTEDSEDVRSVLSLSLKKLKRRPHFEKQSKLLEDLKAKQKILSDEASKYLESSKIYNLNAFNSKSLHTTLSSDIKRLEVLLKNEKTQLDNKSKLSIELNNTLSQNTLKTCSIEYFILKEQISLFESELKDNSEEKENCIKKEVNCKAALIQKKIDIIDRSLDNLNRSMSEDSSINELKIVRDKSASLLSLKLESRIIDLDKSVKVITTKNNEISISNENLEKDKISINYKYSIAKENVAVIKSFETLKNSGLKKLRDDGIINNENPEDKIDQLTKIINDTDISIESNSKEIIEIKKEIDDISICLKSAENEITGYENKISNLLHKINDADSNRKEILNSKIFAQFFGTNDFDIDNIDISRDLNSLIERVKVSSNNILINKESILKELEKLKKIKFAIDNPNTVIALEFLHKNDIASAKLYSEFLSDYYKKDLKSLKKHIESNTGRYTGICVSIEDFKRIEEISDKCELDYPVTVSIAEIVNEKNNYFTLFGKDETFYSIDEVKKRIGSLKRSIKISDDKYDKYNSELNDLYLIKVKIKNYLSCYGSGKFNSYKSEFDSIHEEKIELINKNSLFKIQKESFEKQLDELNNEVNSLSEIRSNTRNSFNNLKTYYDEYHTKSVKYKVELKSLEKNIESFEKEISDCEEKVLKNNSLFEKNNNQIFEYKNLTKEFQTEIENIVFDKIVKVNNEEVQNIPTENLRSRYKNDNQTLNAGLSDRSFDNIKSLIDSKNEQKKSLIDDLSRYKEIDHKLVEELSKKDDSTIIEIEEEARDIIHELMDRSGSLKTEIKKLKKSLKKIKSTDTSLESFKLTDLKDLLIKTKDEEIKIIKEIEILKNESKRFYHKIENLEKINRETKLLIKNIRLDDQLSFESLSEITLNDDIAERESLVDSVNVKFSESLKEQNMFKEKSFKFFNDLIEFAKNDSFKSIEPNLSSEISRSDFENTCKYIDNQLQKTNERIDSVNAVIDESQKDMDLCVNKLMNHTTMAFSKLKRAVKISELPDSLNNYGGKKVLKINTDINSIPFSVRRDEIENYVKRLTESEHIPDVGTTNGDELTADAVQSIVRSKNAKGLVGIKIIKLSRNITYTPVEKVTGSGGESMTSALLLYLVMAQLRAESKGGSKDSAGGFLLMDNPFAKATKPEFVKAQVELANSLGFQLIYATGIKDLNAISQFAHIVQLRPYSYDKVNGRVNVDKISIESAEISTLN